MDVHQRIKVLRQDQHLSQKEFGKRLGVSRSVINNLERGVLVNSNSKLPLIKLMAHEFSVSEDWLLNGPDDKPDYIPTVSADANGYLQAHGADEFEAAVIAAYLNLDADMRRLALRTFCQIIKDANSMLDTRRKQAAE